MLHEIRLFLEKYKYSAALVSAVKKSKIWRSISAYRVRRHEYRREYFHKHDPDRFAIMRAKETREKFMTCYKSHKNMFEATASILEDEFSRETLRTVISYRLAPKKRSYGQSL